MRSSTPGYSLIYIYRCNDWRGFIANRTNSRRKRKIQSDSATINVVFDVHFFSKFCHYACPLSLPLSRLSSFSLSLSVSLSPSHSHFPFLSSSLSPSVEWYVHDIAVGFYYGLFALSLVLLHFSALDFSMGYLVVHCVCVTA